MKTTCIQPYRETRRPFGKKRGLPASSPLHLACCLLLALAPWILPVASADEVPPPGLIHDEWFVVMLQGKKCGHVHGTTTRVGDEIHTRSRMRIQIARGPAKVRLEFDQRYRESLDGLPLAFHHTMNMGQIPVTQTGTIADGRLRLVNEQAGSKKILEYDFDPQIKFAWGQLLEQRKRGVKTGTTFTVKTYEPSIRQNGPVEMTFEFHDKEPVDVLGKRRELTRVTMTLQTRVPITTQSWVDDQANPVVMTIDMGVMQFKMLLATREQALGKSEAPELLIDTFVHTDQRIGGQARKVVLRLALPAEGRNVLPPIPETEMQKVRRVSDHEAVLTIQRLDWDSIRRVTDHDVADDASIKRYLESSTVCDVEDRRIQRRARRAVRSSVTPADKADALRRFVTEFVRHKSLDIGFATASEVVRNQRGDCTEHSVLLAALARASGLPARGVSGIIQIPPGPMSPKKGAAFGYHMWTQVYIGNRWIDIDAAMRQTDCDPTHIALALMPLNDEGMLDSIMSLMPLLGRLRIEVVSVE